MAESQGFEPWAPRGALTFQISAFVHSATIPGAASGIRTPGLCLTKALRYHCAKAAGALVECLPLGGLAEEAGVEPA